MKKIEKITQFVQSLFERYQMNDYGFFRDYDYEIDKVIDVPLFRYKRIDDDILTKLSINFGITVEEILEMDENAGLRWWNKYSFFKFYQEYTHQCNWYQRFKDPEPTTSELLFNMIFGDNKGIPIRHRYDINSIKKRLLEQLKSYDKVVPGTYHKGAEITDLNIMTQTMFSYPNCQKMIISFLDMVDRLKELFFSAINNDLNSNEVNELNFLASWLRAYDKVTVDTLITYDNIMCYRDIYKEENLKDFFDYVIIKGFVDAEPWRCPEFFEDIFLVQRFAYVFPQIKAKMRMFGIMLTKFSCDFVWSDAKPIQFSAEEEKELADFDAIVGIKTIPIEERAKERTHVYVDKNRSELYGWGDYIKTLKRAYGPVSKGGIEVPVRPPLKLENGDLSRMNKRIIARHGGITNANR